MLIVLSWLMILGWAADADFKAWNTNKEGVYLDGYDPTSYFQPTGPKKGNKSFAVEYRGVKFWFATEDNKKIFLADPAKYRPAYGGWCAYAMAKGDYYKVNPKNFKLIDGQVFLFYENLFVDTQKKWNADESTFKSKADAAWTAKGGI